MCLQEKYGFKAKEFHAGIYTAVCAEIAMHAIVQVSTSVLLLYSAAVAVLCTKQQAKPAEKLLHQANELMLLILLTGHGLVCIFSQPTNSLSYAVLVASPSVCLVQKP